MSPKNVTPQIICTHKSKLP